ncbi:MAG: tetratricopeptide repeat protein [Rhodospirillales bacterium]
MLRGSFAAFGLAIAFCIGIPVAQAGPFEDGYVAYGRGAYADALRLFQQAAEAGHAGAQLNLGNMYLTGQGTARDDAAAAAWYRRAADSGNAGAQFSLGTLYRNGWGVPQDYGRAIEWYRRAAEQDFALAENNIGAMYDKGLGVPRDDGEAVRWYQRAAGHGLAIAQFNLGLMLQKGRGGPTNPTEARRLFERAAESGIAGAQNQLGILYATGAAGLARDYVQADKWFTIAASRAADDGVRALALQNQDRLAPQMTPGQRADAQKLARAWSPQGATLAEERGVPRQVQ